MTPAAHQLLRALYLHALAPSTANQDAVRAAGAALDTETGRKLNAPRSPTPPGSIVAEVRADLLARSGVGIAKYGVTLDRRDLGHAQWLQHGYEEALDLACYLKRAMRDVTDDAAHAGHPLSAGDLAALAALQADLERKQAAQAEAMGVRSPPRAPVEPPHADAPFLATLTPEPAEAVLGRAGEALGAHPLPYSVMQPGWTPPPGVLKAPSGDALAWDGQQLPVWVEYKPGTRHPYGDAAYHVAAHETPDGMARLFPSREAACVWLAAMGKVPV